MTKIHFADAMQCDPSTGRREAVILPQGVPGSDRAIRAFWNTWVFLTETRVVADDDHELTPGTSIHQVQHTPSTAYTKYSIPKIVCFPFMLTITDP